MKVIGLTGGSGSGKSLISEYLKDHGAKIVDADAISHSIIEKGKPAYTEIVDFFGKDILDAKDEIQRRSLGSIVFADSKKLAFLNSCTHHHIYEEIKRQIDECRPADCKSADCKSADCKSEDIVVLDSPLFDDKLCSWCTEVWLVFADNTVRINRIVERDNISFEEAKKRLQSQNSFTEYEKFATYILDNSRDIPYLIEQLHALLFLQPSKRTNETLLKLGIRKGSACQYLID